MGDVAERRGTRVDAGRLAAGLGVPTVSLDPRRRDGAARLAEAAVAALDAPAPAPRIVADVDRADELAVADERFAWIERAVSTAVRVEEDVRPTWTDRIDRVATAPWIGPAVFLAVMWAVFELTTTVAAPIQDALGTVFSGPVTRGTVWLFDHIGLGGSWLQMFVVNGLIGGVGMLLTFVPLMIIMFALLALLEDSGYMARAAVVTDRMMRAVGLPGKAFLPLVVGFGCNVPAISATRILPNAKHRVMTALLVPFTSCSARLTVYVLVAATFFPAHAGSVVFGMYVVSVLLVVLVGLAMKATLWRAVGDEPLMLDLPAYQRPDAAPDHVGDLGAGQGVPALGRRDHRRHRVGGVGAAGDPGPRRRRLRPRGARRQPVRRAGQSAGPGVRPAGLRRLAHLERARGRVRREGNGHHLVGADLRGGRPDRRAVAGAAAAPHPPRVPGLLGRCDDRRRPRLPRVPAGLHAVRGHGRRAAARDRRALDGVRPGSADRSGVGARLCRLPDRPGDRMTSPLRSVLASLAAGAHSRAEVSRRTGLSADVVDAAVDHLVRLGRLETSELSSGCPTGGCGSCASGSGDGTPGCGAPGPSAQRRGPVLVQLSVRG